MLVRCGSHPSKVYTHSVGRCDKPGMILLNEREWKAYQTGQTVFSFNNNIMQVEAEKPA